VFQRGKILFEELTLLCSIHVGCRIVVRTLYIRSKRENSNPHIAALAGFSAHRPVYRFWLGPTYSLTVLIRTEAVDAAFYRILFVTICRSKEPASLFFAHVEQSSLLKHSAAKGCEWQLTASRT
jgi:hypothetical protein